MKTFEDLEFKAEMHFPNGYGISVMKGKHLYCDKDTFEVAILKGNHICYDTPITDDVLGYQTPDQITEIMRKIQLLNTVKVL